MLAIRRLRSRVFSQTSSRRYRCAQVPQWREHPARLYNLPRVCQPWVHRVCSHPAELKGRKVGIVSNPASVDANYVHIVDALMNAPGVTVGALFGPQHGFRSDVQDNMIETPHGNDCRRKVPVYSLYSETREPTAEMLRHVDTMVIDLQDIGARIYTYIYTMANCLRACAKHGVDVIVCDRPNPIGGVDVEGPMLVPGNESFVGQFPIPMRHGMTIGELARFFNEYFEIKAPLEVVDDGGLVAIDVLRSRPACRS